jgi:hypothetical protein
MTDATINPSISVTVSSLEEIRAWTTDTRRVVNSGIQCGDTVLFNALDHLELLIARLYKAETLWRDLGGWKEESHAPEIRCGLRRQGISAFGETPAECMAEFAAAICAVIDTGNTLGSHDADAASSAAGERG